MIKRKFGMKTLRISQSRFNDFSHKTNNAYDLVGIDNGIDFLYATCRLEIIGILSYSKTGFANTVFFYDRENDITIACTHMNDISKYYVGQVFNDGDFIYAEGTKGKATGNHIHVEFAKGRQIKKQKINGIWRTINQINIEDYYYINSDINVLDTKGINFEFKTNNREDVIEVMGDLKPIGKITVHRIGLHIRNRLSFNQRKPLGNRVGFVNKGEDVEILGFIPGLQPDGFQWVKVKWGKGEAYAQYDSTCYTVELY